jgi:hypothetical protein
MMTVMTAMRVMMHGGKQQDARARQAYTPHVKPHQTTILNLTSLHHTTPTPNHTNPNRINTTPHHTNTDNNTKPHQP